MKALTFLARRFVAGETIDEAVEAVGGLNTEGIKVTLDFLGEDCQNRDQAAAAAQEYARAVQRIAEAGVDCNVSLKLTQLGLNLDRSLARDQLGRVAEQARRHGDIFVRIDMESSAYTQMTLDLFYEMFGQYPNLGVVIQAYLRRSESDVDELVRRRARVRLCKGAYKEPPDVAFPDKAQVNANYDKLAEKLLKAPLPAFATHDDERIERVIAAARRTGLAKKDFELQMLYGLRPRRWSELVAAGHSVRVYMPYGTHWLPYFSRRIRERKENLMFVVKNLFH